jgi:hypothetical protein
MKNLKHTKILVFVITAALLLQAGYISYSMIGSNIFGESPKIASKDTPDPRNQINGEGESERNNVKTVKSDDNLQDDFSVEISKEILDLIKSSDPENYTRNVENYKKLLNELNVHISFKNEIERLIKNDYKLPNILTAYSFLNDSYGSVKELEVMVKEKVSGSEWNKIFKKYNKNNPEFVPSNFDSQYLDKLIQTPGIDQDVIMIADRVSQKANTQITDVLEKKVKGMSWRLINAQYGIVNGQENSPHLSVTREQLEKYTSKTKLSEKQVIKAMAIADKLGIPADDILESMKKGLSKEDIYADAYQKRYY